MVMGGDPQALLDMLEAETGLAGADYGAPDCRQRLRDHFDRLFPTPAAMYAISLVGALGMVRRNDEGLRVLEVFLDLRNSDYRDIPHLLEKLRERVSGIPADFQVILILELAGSLGVAGRNSDSVALLRADLALDVESLGDPEACVADLEVKLARRLRDVSPDGTAAYLGLVAASLSDLGIGSTGVAALERHLGLRPGDYRSSGDLEARLGPWLRRLTSPVAGVLLLMAIAGELEGIDRSRALALIEWYVGTGDYRDVIELGRVWRDFCARYPADVGLTTWRVWSGILVEDGRVQDALALIEADSGLREADLASPERFGPKLEHRLARAQIDTRAAYVLSLVLDLGRLGHVEHGHLIADWYVRGYDDLWHVPDGGDPAVPHMIPLLAYWLRNLSARDPGFSWRLCEQAVRYLRRSLLLDDMKMADRREFIGYIDDLRRQILQVGDRWSTTGTVSPNDEPRILQAQLWDAELGQRRLFEEFLLTTVEPIPPAEIPEDRWPLNEPEPVEHDSHLPDPASCRDEDLLSLLRSRHDRRRPAESARTTSDERHPPPDEWLDDAARIVRAGVTEGLLAETLGDGAMLVRAGFRADGALVWAALRTRGDGTVRVAASGVGDAGDATRLHWAAFRYDLGLLLSSAWQGGDTDAARMLVRVLSDAAAAITRALDAVAAGSDEADRGHRAEIDQALARLDSPLSSIAEEERLGSRLRGLLSRDSSADRLGAEIAGLGRILAHHASGPEPGTGLDEIDHVTRAFLDEVADVWSLDALAERLDPGDDVVFQLEDVLQSVPAAHYPLAPGVPLYSRVRSTRVSLSLLLTIMQTRLDARFAVPSARMLATSYFDPGDPAGKFEKWLHRGQRRLARRHMMTCLNAAHTPPGAAGGLRAATDGRHTFRTVTVCGHGSSHETGIELSDGLWRGDGCDWRNVDLLLLASCSVGRLEQTEDQDVEGLCVRLALHRARAVLACRWPVLAPQAIAFANEVVAQYLELSRQAGDGATAATNLRARAVNAARHRFLRGGDARVAGEPAGLNTVAAFELYGLG